MSACNFTPEPSIFCNPSSVLEPSKKSWRYSLVINEQTIPLLAALHSNSAVFSDKKGLIIFISFCASSNNDTIAS